MTRKQRNRIYRKMLEGYNGTWFNLHFNGLGLCFLITHKIGGVDGYNTLRENLPELHNKKPVNEFSSLGWWSFDEEGYLIRVMALLEAIKETE